jgi:hypothetical protein
VVQGDLSRKIGSSEGGSGGHGASGRLYEHSFGVK